MRPELPVHTSASQLGCYARCPRQYKYRYIEQREPERAAVALAVGTAVHAAVQYHFEQRARGKSPTPSDALRVLRAELGALLSDPKLNWTKTTPAEARAEAERLLQVFLRELADLPVAHCEAPFEIALHDPITGEPLPRPLLGYLDHVLTDGTVIELKTTARRYSDTDIAANLQFAAYRVVARRQRRPDVRLVALLKTKTPTAQLVSMGVASHAEERWFLEAVRDIERGIHAGVFPPSPGMACSTCDFREACRGVEEVHRAEAA